MLFATVAAAQGGAQPAGVPAPVVQASEQVNAVTQAAIKQGVQFCAARINQVTNFLGYKPQSGVLLMVPPGQPDQRLLPIAMEVAAGPRTAYVSANFAPNQANGCGASYDAVFYSPLKCDAVQAKRYASLKKVGMLGKDIVVLDGGVATKVFLMPAGSGCVSIKKEVVI